ncbi:hypothetical protein NKH34_19330 [Mesorhizobium sp. M1148]|uniref:hypothetical protein n=1 Tax=unclassified Mesorhizobium TaxID=325217 RepID=UPI0003CF5C96|nr:MULTISPECIES: hypothetical protein [unclassified Mesorhizobium]ESX34127.1 hypothetical protein X764_28705 [Mesorhizobium sp. LSHC440A00]WJI55966.1 hypothetical protein NLY33_22590 [Mesorhizobium sp. C432A]
MSTFGLRIVSLGLRAFLGLGASLILGAQASAQTSQPAQQSGDSSQTGKHDRLPAQGSSPTAKDDVGVDVSLGRPEVKQQVARHLGVAETELPLAVHVPIALASQVCGQEVFTAHDNVNRSCTATKFIPEIAEAARNHPQTSAVPEQ